MAASVNKVIIVGNLGRDPEVRHLPSGESVCNLAVATTEKWKDKNTGEAREETEWHKVSLFGRNADNAGQYLFKGSSVYIEGKLKTRKYVDKGGVEKYSTEVVGHELKFLSSPGGQGGQQRQQPQQPQRQAPQQRQQPQRQAPAQPGRGGFSDEFDSDEIPF